MPGKAYRQGVDGQIDWLDTSMRGAYEVARDAARAEFGWQRVKWARGKGENDRGIERGEGAWDYVTNAGITYHWSYPP